MKKILLCFMAVAAATMFFSCQKANDGKCHIEGSVIGEQYEGKRIFIVPLYGPKTAEYVDSMEITDGKFHFTKDSMQMYKILLDYHYRMGVQPLLALNSSSMSSRILRMPLPSAGSMPSAFSITTSAYIMMRRR